MSNGKIQHLAIDEGTIIEVSNNLKQGVLVTGEGEGMEGGYYTCVISQWKRQLKYIRQRKYIYEY